jgi:hypothetical protein
MKKLLFSAGVILSFLGFLLIIPSGAQASNKVSLDWRSELQPENCNAIGKPIINVVQKVSGDADSGLGGFWAYDKYSRHIRVWKTSTEGTYCTIVKYLGIYTTIPGQNSPGNTGVISKKSIGSMQGGYIGTINGNLSDPTLWPKKGFVGKYDYNCDVNNFCPGKFSWMDKYFQTDYGFNYIWWGWIYRGGHHGVWVNACSLLEIPGNSACVGNSGDIK